MSATLEPEDEPLTVFVPARAAAPEGGDEPAAVVVLLPGD